MKQPNGSVLRRDLTLSTRKRGNDWVYTYLKTFYTDPSRPLGVNNLVFEKSVCRTFAALAG